MRIYSQQNSTPTGPPAGLVTPVLFSCIERLCRTGDGDSVVCCRRAAVRLDIVGMVLFLDNVIVGVRLSTILIYKSKLINIYEQIVLLHNEYSSNFEQFNFPETVLVR